MNAETEILTEEKLKTTLETASEEKPVAVYSVNFARVIGNFGEKRLVPKRRALVGKKQIEKSLSKKIFNWRNAVPVAAILAIGVLHFAFQISVIRPEVSENRSLVEVPPIKIEALRAVPVEAVPVVADSKKEEPVAPQKTAGRVKPRQTEIRQLEVAPTKPANRKKDTVETRAERLRRAERLLTGI